VIKKADPVRRKVIAAAIIAVLAAPAIYLVGLWTLFAGWLGSFWRLLADSTLVPNWLLGLLALCTIILAGILGTSLRPTKEIADPADCERTD
jgi:fatty acid desaturase